MAATTLPKNGNTGADVLNGAIGADSLKGEANPGGKRARGAGRCATRMALPLERIGLEACSLTAWLHDGLRTAGLPAVCIETRQANAAMKADAEQDRPQ